jgi:hypothetical protein
MPDTQPSQFQSDDNSGAGSTNGGVGVPGKPTTPIKNPSSLAASGGNKNTTKYTAKRRDNPLGKLSSHTYQISLYLVEPTILNQYFDNFAAGRKFSLGNNGVYIVAQSGGINQNEDRAITLGGTPGPGPGYDYFIDELKFSQIMPTKDSTNTPTSDMSFNIKIVEPIGFNFVFQLRKASDAISRTDPLLSDGTIPNEYQQKYLLGIRFYGYDENGQLLKAKSIDEGDTLSGLTDEYAIYERFFPIEISTFSFRLDGRATVYDIEAVPTIMINAYGQKHNTIKKKTTLVGTTVEEALIGKSGQKSNSTVRGLIQILNEEANEMVALKRREKADVYKIEFAKNTDIANSKLIDTKVYDKTLAPMAAVNRTNQSTVAQSERAKTIDINRTQVVLEAGKSITQIIDNIISSSSYVFDVLNQKTDEQIQVDGTPNPTTRNLKWYSITPKTKILGRDAITKDWVYEITYYIQEYWVPYIRTPYSEYLIEYYGAVKKYNYWYTGLNTEIINLTFTYNNLYYNIIPYTTSSDTSAANGGQGNAIQSVEGAPGHSDPTVSPNRKNIYNQNVHAQIYNDADNNHLQFQIIGDPDFLMTTLATPYLNKSEFDKFYGPGQVIDPMGGQIFVEIVFNSAIDYQDDGLLQLTNPIQFYPTKSKELKETFGIEGLIVEVTQCHTSFARGQFTQNLEGILLDERLLLEKSTRIKSDINNEREETTQNQSIDLGLFNALSDADSARVNLEARVNAAKFPYVNPQTSLGKAVQQSLNKPAQIDNPSVTQVQNSDAYINLRRQGVSASEAYRLAKESLISGTPVKQTPTGPVADDDASPPPSGSRPSNFSRENIVVP